MTHVLEQGFERVAFSKFLIAMARFTTQKKDVPYVEIKKDLKEALLLICNTPISADDEGEDDDEYEN